MIKFFLALFILLVLVGFGYLGYMFYIGDGKIKTPIEDIEKTASRIVEKPLEKYQLKRLKEVTFTEGKITFGEIINEEDDEAEFVSRIFYFRDFGPTGEGEGKKVSGLINYPKEPGEYPVIVMLRGFVDKAAYTPGEGTRRSGQEFAKNGYITLAPDFLGFGESDNPSEVAVEERFETYTTALSLLASLQNLNSSLETDETEVMFDNENIGIWAHSNGGQIALTTLGITEKEYPTVLWAPVTKPFPYNILYFTDEYDDEGKGLRKVVSDFEKDYDVFEYSIQRYLSWIKAPLQLHQGSSDEAVPQRWSDQFVDLAEEKELDIEYFIYPGENHNFNLGSYDEAIGRTIEFFDTKFEKTGEVD